MIDNSNDKIIIMIMITSIYSPYDGMYMDVIEEGVRELGSTKA